MFLCFFFFFFQAEDGIRDVAVTGVQTCALPISFESLLQVQPDLSLKMESELEEVLRMAELIESELDEASGISELERLDRRIEFIEDRFEELEAELYSRPRRRRKRRPNLFDFFRQATGGGGWGGSTDPQGEV